MKTEEAQVLTLLRMALWSGETDDGLLSASSDWDTILRIAEKQSVQGLVASAILSWLERNNVESGIEQACLATKFRTLQGNEHVNDVLGEVFRILRSAGFSPVLVKGQGVARYYPEPMLRMAGDIDLYLGGEAERAGEMLAQFADHDTFHKDKDEKHINLAMKGVEVELHRQIIAHIPCTPVKVMEPWLTDGLLPQNCRTAVIAANDITVPSLMLDVVYVFYHLWYHIMHSGIGLRQLCDLMMILHCHHGEVDIKRLEPLLRQAHLLREWQVMGTILVNFLGLPKNEFPLYNRSLARIGRMQLREILRLGNFGKEDYNGFLEGNTSHGWCHRLRTMLFFMRRDGYNFLMYPRTTIDVRASFYIR